MRYFLASDDATTAGQIGAILAELRQECPASRVLGLDHVMAALEVSATDRSKSPVRGSVELLSSQAAVSSDDVVLLVFPPNPERAMAVLREIRRRISARVLAVGPATDTKLVLRAIREGATEYLDLGDLRDELSEALRRLETSETAGKIIGVLAPSGGSGASTLAVNLATALAQKQGTCALIDLKLEAGDLAPLLDLKPTHTIADLCQNFERLDSSLLQGCLATCDSGVRLLAAPARIAEAARVTPEAIDAVLPLVRRHFPFVVVDLDHTYHAEQKAAMLLADVIVLVLRLDFISLRNTRIALDSLNQIGVAADRVRIVANRCGTAGQLSETQAEESLGIKLSQVIPEDPKAVNRANNNGVPVVLQSPSAKVSRCLTELAANLAESLMK